MKNKSILFVVITAFFVISLIASGKDNQTKSNSMPDKVKATIEKSCFGCHNTASKNKDAKEDLDFKKLVHTKKLEKPSRKEKCLPKNSSKNFLIKNLLNRKNSF